MVQDATIVVTDVSKWYGQKVAVSGVTCAFGAGVTGLLGPNGAGKTTLMHMITGLITTSKGAITVLGERPRQHPDVYRSMAFVPEEGAVHGHLTARQFVTYSAELSGVAEPGKAADSAIETVALTDAADRNIGGYSKGMRQRAKLAAALVTDPGILILDEPLNGTDPVQRSNLMALFRQLGDEGHTVIVSSHVLQEVERMTDRVIAMVDGKLAAAGDIAAIRSAMTHIPYRVRISADDARRLAAEFLAAGVVNGVTVDGASMQVETGNLRELGTAAPGIARRAGVRITEFRPEDDSLESVFRYLVRRT